MPSQAPKGFVLPDVRKARTFGLAGVIIASISLLAFDLGGAAYYAFLPSMAKMTHEMEKQMVRQQKEEREARLEELREQEAEAKTAAEKKVAHDDLADLEATPAPPTPPMSYMFEGYSDRRVLTLLWVDAGANLVLNILMIVGCGGLIALREWGRKTAIVSAILKVVECVLMTFVLVVVAAPIIGELMGARLNTYMSEMAASSAGSGAPRGLPDIRMPLTIFNAAAFVVLGLLGLIWPIILLVGIAQEREGGMRRERARASGEGVETTTERRMGVGPVVNSILSLPFGPLAVPECTARRGAIPRSFGGRSWRSS